MNIEKEIEVLIKWDILNTGTRSLIEYLKTIWWMPDWGIKSTQRRFKISTGGWGENEELIDALMKNFLIGGFCWLKTERGGHYYFKHYFPKNKRG